MNKHLNFIFLENWGLGIGDWGLGMGIGDWAQSPIPRQKLYSIKIEINFIF